MDTPRDLPLHAGELTHQPTRANVSVDKGVPKKLSESKWSQYSIDLNTMYTQTIAARQAFNNNLRDYQNAYDMLAYGTDFPWIGASNVRLPYTASQLENLKARILGTVMQHGRLYLVSGDTPEAVQNQSQVEDWLNAGLRKRRSDGSSYFDKYDELTQFGLRDGTGIMELLWTQEREHKEFETLVKKLNPLTQQPMLGEDGQPLTEMQKQRAYELIRDYTVYSVVPIKEFYIVPNESRTLQKAPACFKIEWLYEDDLDRMCRAETLDAQECESALAYLIQGQTGVATDITGNYDKSATKQINIGPGQGAIVGKDYKNRGPLLVARFHSRQFDMNGDGIVEENVFWFSPLNQRMLGFEPYNYVTGLRPFFKFCPFPRPGEFYGFSLVERLSGVQTSLDANKNARNNQQMLSVSPPIAVPPGSEIINKGGPGTFRPNAFIEIPFSPSGEPMFKQLMIGQIPTSSYQEEAIDKQYGNEYTGQDQMALGGQTSGRRSAREVSQRAATADVRSQLIANQLRGTIEQIITFDFKLNLQYLTKPESVLMHSANGPQQLNITLDVLLLPYTIAVAGSADPIDSTTRVNEFLSVFQIAMSLPYIQGNPQFVYEWLKRLCELKGLRGYQQLIGTPQDVQNFMKMQQQQAQQKMQLDAQIAAHGQQPKGV